MVDRLHAEVLPSPFLSSVIEGCAEKGLDVTAGGARYNLSGIQAIQPANVADCLAAIKQCVYDDQSLDAPRRPSRPSEATTRATRRCASISSTRSRNTATTWTGWTPSRPGGSTISPAKMAGVHERPRGPLPRRPLHGVRPRAHGAERRRLSGRAQGEGPAGGRRHVRDVRPGQDTARRRFFARCRRSIRGTAATARCST